MAPNWIFWIYSICYGGLVPLLLFVPELAADDIPPNLCQVLQPKRDGQVCYWLVSELNPWTDAQARCKQDGGNLALISDDLDNSFVVGLLEDNQVSEAWIGLTESTFSWRWIKDGAEPRLQGCYKDDSSSRDMSTRTLFPDATQDKCVDYCRTQGYLYAGLQAETSCFCGDSFGKYGAVGFGAGGCIQVCPGDPDRLTKCGGDLSSVIFSVNGGFENWLNGQPNNHQGYQLCAAIELDDDYKFNDVKCRERKGSICHIYGLNSTQCEDEGYTLINGTWCLNISNEIFSWFETRKQCLEEGGDMLEIRDPLLSFHLSEYLLSRNWTSLGFWLGLTRGSWTWENGEEAIFTRWHPDRPNGVDQRCAAIDTRGEWNDASCTAVYPAVCYIDNSTKPTTPAPTTEQSITTAVPEEEGGFSESDRNFFLIIGGIGLLMLILFIAGMCQLKLCCKDKREKNKNDFFFEFDTKGSTSGEGSSSARGEGREARENGHVNTGFDGPPAPGEDDPVYTNIDGVTEEFTTSSTAQLTVHQQGEPLGNHRPPSHREREALRPKSEEQKVMETFDLIADLDGRSMDAQSIDAKTMIY